MSFRIDSFNCSEVFKMVNDLKRKLLSTYILALICIVQIAFVQANDCCKS